MSLDISTQEFGMHEAWRDGVADMTAWPTFRVMFAARNNLSSAKLGGGFPAALYVST
jgi:hypothetical protein